MPVRERVPLKSKRRGQEVTFKEGEFVRLRGDPGRSGVVLAGEKMQAGERMVRIRSGNGSVSWLPAENLELVPDAPPDLPDQFAAGQFVDPGWLRRTLTRIRVTGRLSDVVYSMEATETDFYAFQFKPVLKFLNSPTDALLIADEVGLGKTIEAGLIWTELRARFECNRLLVVCPKTLCEKWREELDRRFGVDARIVDAEGLLNLLSEHRRPGRGFAAVASMQGLRPTQGWNAEGATDGQRARNQLARRLDDAAEDEPLLDLLVVDEAHHLRNPKTLLHQSGNLLNSVSAHRIFLSATPIHLRSRDLHSLLRLIDPDTFEYESTLEVLISINEPIVEARDLLMQSDASKSEVMEIIDNAHLFDFLAESRELRLLREDMMNRPFNIADRAEFAFRLEQVNQMANYVTRTRRRDVEDMRIVRQPHAPHLEMSKAERKFYGEMTEAVENYALERDVNELFLLSTPQRLLTSSPAAASAYWAGPSREDQSEIEETDDDLRNEGVNMGPLHMRLASLSRRLNMTQCLERGDTKFQLLLDELRRLWQSEPEAKIIVFSGFKPTLNYLRRRLDAVDIGSELLHGSVSEPRHQILERFRKESRARILLSSEVGSEGVDLQFCWIVVNYDLPWNPMKVEQRVGRVDRLGQSRQAVTVLNLVYADTIDDKIYRRLYKRLNLIERTLGEFEDILGEPIREMTQKLLAPKLTDEDQEKIIGQTAQAVENRKSYEEQLELEAGALIRHGDHILRKIDENRRLHRWISGDDIRIYVKDRLDRSFPGCEIETSPPGSDTYRIVLSPTAREGLLDFMTRRGVEGTTRLIEDNRRQRYRFTSSVAQLRRGQVEDINQLHVLVRFAIELDERDEEAREGQAVAASISGGKIKFECSPGIHVLGIRRMQISTAGDRASDIARIAYVGAKLDSGELMPYEDAETLAAAAAERGELLPNFGTDERLPAATELLCDRVLPELDRMYEEFIEREKAKIEDRAAIQERAIKGRPRIKANDLKGLVARQRCEAKSIASDGEEVRSLQLLRVAEANEGKLRKLESNISLRLKKIEEQRRVHPEWSDVACLLIEVTS